jgi:hypothetical protein
MMEEKAEVFAFNDALIAEAVGGGSALAQWGSLIVGLARVAWPGWPWVAYVIASVLVCITAWSFADCIV